jgi:hypothetical protein
MGIDPINAVNVQRAKERDEAVRLYAGHTTKKVHAPICPECRKREVQPPKRFCYQCAVDREARRNRERHRKPAKTESNVPKTAIAIP